MRIQRNTSRLSFRSPRRRRMGCVLFTFMVGVMVGIGVLSWTWLERRFNLTPNPNQASSALSDDGGTGQDARIDRYTLPTTGLYYIAATRFGAVSENGTPGVPTRSSFILVLARLQE